jgi:conjugative transfer region protein (TIGR03748 family)
MGPLLSDPLRSGSPFYGFTDSRTGQSKDNDVHSMRILVAVSGLVLMLTAGQAARAQAGNAAATGAGELRLARYTTQAIAPEPQAGHPLAVVATVHFPRGQVRSVGEALVHLLARTGYALVPADQLSEAARALLDLPLPESHRRLGPYRVDAMLQVLLGDAWSVEIDGLGRRVRFEADGCNPVIEARTGEARRHDAHPDVRPDVHLPVGPPRASRDLAAGASGP